MSAATPTDNKETLTHFDSGNQAVAYVDELLKTVRRQICLFGGCTDPVTLNKNKVTDYLREFVQQLKQKFEAIWANSHPDSNVRQLLL